MDDELRDLRRELARVDRGRGHWYPEQLRARVGSWARRQRSRGTTWREIAAGVGVPFETVRRWTPREASGPLAANATLVPIEIVSGSHETISDDDRPLRIVTRAGHAIENLTTADALAIVRVLG